MQRNEVFWILLVSAALLLFSYLPILQNYKNAPADRFYYGQPEYPIDMLGDLAYVQEGYHGNGLASFNYSTHLGSHPTILKFEYILIGWAGRLTGLDPLKAFIVSRVLLSLAIFAVLYSILRKVFSSAWQRGIAYALVLFGTGVIIPGIENVFADWGGYDTQVFPRLTQAMPHYLIGILSVLLSLYFLAKVLRKPTDKLSFILSAVFGVITSLVYAPDAVLLLSGFPLYLVFEAVSHFMQSRRIRINIAATGILFAYGMIAILPLLFTRYVTTYIWKDIQTARMEFLLNFHLTPQGYLMAVGLLFVISIFAIPSVIRKGNPLMMLLATWIAMHPIGEYLLSPLLHINYIRYFLTPYWVAYGIIGTAGMLVIAGWVKGVWPRISTRAVSGIIGILILASSIGIYKTVWKTEHICFCVSFPFDYAYPKRSVSDGIFWLSRNTHPGSVVLSDYFSGMMIAAFSGNKVYTSWWYHLIETPDLGQTDADLHDFYGNRMSDDAARNFLKRERISYVFYSQYERDPSVGLQPLTYTDLEVSYDKEGTMVYRVKE